MKELYEKLEKAIKELDKAYQMDDWDYILTCSMDVYAIRREIEAYGYGEMGKRNAV